MSGLAVVALVALLLFLRQPLLVILLSATAFIHLVWGRGQLDEEIKQNAWLNVPGDEALLFLEDTESKWERVLAKIGVSPHLLSGTAGRA